MCICYVLIYSFIIFMACRGGLSWLLWPWGGVHSGTSPVSRRDNTLAHIHIDYGHYLVTNVHDMWTPADGGLAVRSLCHLCCQEMKKKKKERVLVCSVEVWHNAKVLPLTCWSNNQLLVLLVFFVLELIHSCYAGMVQVAYLIIFGVKIHWIA